MSRKPVVALLLGVLVAGALAVAYSASGDDVASLTVTPEEPHLRSAYPRAAAAAYGRRVLVLHARPLAPVAGEILESARVGGGWELHVTAPAGADVFTTRLAELAATAAGDWDDDRGLSAGTVDALARAGVAIVLVHDGRAVVTSERAAETAGLAPDAQVPGLRVRGAEPVLRVAGEETVRGELRPQLEPARVRDFRDGLWGGRVVVEAPEAGTYVFAWPAELALVTVDGAPLAPAEAVTEVPLVTLELPAGDSTVEVRYDAASRGPGWAIGGALAIVVSLIALLLVLRPHPERDEDRGP